MLHNVLNEKPGRGPSCRGLLHDCETSNIAKGVSCSVQALDYVGSVTWSPQLQQRLTGAQIPYPVSHELSAGRPVELNLSSKHCTNCCYSYNSTLLTTSPGRQVHIEGFGGVVELGGHTGGDGGDVPVSRGSGLEIHIHSDDTLHNLHIC